MTDAVTNTRQADLTTAATPQAITQAATQAVADRIATQLEGTDVCVACIDENGRLTCVSHNASRFFTHYAIPALQSLNTRAESVATLDGRVPGVVVRALSLAAKRAATGQTTPVPMYLLIGRRHEVDATSEDVQRWCSRLQIDAAWLASEAAQLSPLTPGMLARLAELSVAANAADQRATSLQTELDSLSGQLSETYEELSLIYQISSGMRVNRKVDDFFLQACTDVISVMGVRAAGYAVVDANGRVETSSIFGEPVLSPVLVAKLQGNLIRRFTHSPKPLLNNRLSEDPAFAFLAGHVNHLVAVPIQRQDKVLGLLFCLDKLEADFTTQDSKLLNSIANETAIYLENSNLFGDARGMMMGLLHALTSAVDAKDPYTCGHSQRVALFGREIAQRAGLAEPMCERVYMAGLLHDVGKIGVPEEVLRKPGKLTDEEFAQMKKHVEIGARILKDVRQVDDLIPGVLYHHERFDGKGYPHKLAGQNIPLVARILCVADCFDAMTSNRTYRKALPIEVALMEIRRCAGTQFDPVLADAFLSIGATRLRELIASVTDQMSIQIAA